MVYCQGTLAQISLTRDMEMQSMQNVSQTTRSQTSDVALELMGHISNVLLTTGLYGVYFACVFLSVIVLTRNGLRKPPTTILLCIVIGMLASTTIHWAASILNMLAELEMVISASGLACLSDPKGQACTPLVFQSSGPDRLQLQYCTWSSALTINIALSDAIVWWRVYAVWGGNRFITALGLTVLLPSIVLRVVGATYRCTRRTLPHVVIIMGGTSITKLSDLRELGTGSLFIGSMWGLMGDIFSVLVNLLATALITYKAWHHRRFVRDYLRAASSRSQAERVLFLLIESGVAYCLIWIVTVTYQVICHRINEPNKTIHTYNKPWFLFLVALETLTAGGLPTMIAIYPTTIIVVVALKSPQWESGITFAPSIRELVAVQTPHFAQSIKSSLRCPSPALRVERGPDADC